MLYSPIRTKFPSLSPPQSALYGQYEFTEAKHHTAPGYPQEAPLPWTKALAQPSRVHGRGTLYGYPGAGRGSGFSEMYRAQSTLSAPVAPTEVTPPLSLLPTSLASATIKKQVSRMSQVPSIPKSEIYQPTRLNFPSPKCPKKVVAAPTWKKSLTKHFWNLTLFPS